MLAPLSVAIKRNTSPEPTSDNGAKLFCDNVPSYSSPETRGHSFVRSFPRDQRLKNMTIVDVYLVAALRGGIQFPTKWSLICPIIQPSYMRDWLAHVGVVPPSSSAFRPVSDEMHGLHRCIRPEIDSRDGFPAARS